MATPFGIRLRQLREAKGMSLQQLADEVGCTKAYIWELEKKDGQKPTAERVLALSKVFGVTMEDLMEDQPRNLPDVEFKDVAFFREYSGMADDDKKRFRQALDLMFGKNSDAEPQP